MKFKQWLEATTEYVEKLKDPALMTWDEYWKMVNPSDRYHPDGAYSYSIEDQDYHKITDYPTLIFTKKFGGVPIEFRMNKKDRYKESRFVKTDADGDVVRDENGNAQYFTIEELHKQGIRRWDYSFAAIHDGKIVGYAQDEWGCMLVSVANEYQELGIGRAISKLAREAEPGKDSGGCTARGATLVKKVHGDFVKEYMQNGFYTHLVKQGIITAQRAKEIIDSADIKSSKKEQKDFNFNDPEDWVLFADTGTFVIYSKKLKDFDLDNPNHFYWAERGIKGHAFVGSGYNDSQYKLMKLGGDSDNIKKYLLYLCVEWTAEENDPLFIYEEDRKYVDTSKINLQPDGWATPKVRINYKPVAMAEKRFRKSFDQYDEFYHRMIELANAKYDT